MGNVALHGLVYAFSGIILTILAVVLVLSILKLTVRDKGEEKVISRELLEKQKLEIETKGDDIVDTSISPSQIRKELKEKKKKDKQKKRIENAPAAGKYSFLN